MLKKQIGKVFPTINAKLAYYSPTSFSVTLNEITEQEYQSFAKGWTDERQAEKYSILVHELRHHLDHISTLWGWRHILKLYRAVNARIIPDEFQFHHILPLKIEEGKFHYDTYYSFQSYQVKWRRTSDNWQWKLSAGLKFDIQGKPDEKRPILFINFAAPTGQHLTRVPLSIAALLETSAIRDELEVMHRYIHTLKGDEALIEEALLQRKTFEEIIYNQQMAVYNSIVHLTANILGLNDTMLALNISSAIATISLNLPHTLLARIPIPKIASDTWKDRCSDMMEQHDYAFIFYCLLYNYKELYQQDQAYNIEQLLLANNLPASAEIMALIEGELSTIIDEISNKDNFKQQFLKTMAEGKRLFRLRGLDGTNNTSTELIRKHNYQPFVICSDTDFPLEEYYINNSLKLPMDNLSPEQWYSFSMSIDQKFDEFFLIRGL